MKVERLTDTSYNKVIDEFTKKNKKTELMFKYILISHL